MGGERVEGREGVGERGLRRGAVAVGDVGADEVLAQAARAAVRGGAQRHGDGRAFVRHGVGGAVVVEVAEAVLPEHAQGLGLRGLAFLLWGALRLRVRFLPAEGDEVAGGGRWVEREGFGHAAAPVGVRG